LSLSFPIWSFEALRQTSSASLYQTLFQNGSVLIRDFPVEDNHHELIKWAESLGHCLQEPWLPSGEKVALVQVDQASQLPAYADTPFAFGLHTDCSEQNQPPDLVILQCVRPAKEGGASHFLSLTRLLKHLSLADQHLLKNPVFPFREQFFPILESHAAGYSLRYNRLYQEIFKTCGGLLAPEYEALLNRVDALMQKLQNTFYLQAGDCWLLLNQHSLHGRSAFPADSDRLLKRMRLHLQVYTDKRV
jgi:alpha-ketoglutarate-dependent taurine dioxygenase